MDELPVGHQIVQASPSSVTIRCYEPDCRMEIELTIAVKVILEPTANGRRSMYALGRPNTQPIWDHMLSMHTDLDFESIGETDAA